VVLVVEEREQTPVTQNELVLLEQLIKVLEVVMEMEMVEEVEVLLVVEERELLLRTLRLQLQRQEEWVYQ
tara:strand:+ start:362 stop:571 length:210 start_codon:yes stop_codon:yes gene_type:complete